MEPSDPLQRSFSVYVRPEDFPRAKKIDEELFSVEVPDSEGIPHVEDLDFWTCPACGNRLGENDLKCSSCGLNLSPSEKIRCKNCDEVIQAESTECPYCGYAVTRSKG